MNLKKWFPTFERLAHRTSQRSFLPALRNPAWRITPWWPSDSLRIRQLSLLRILRAAFQRRLDPVPLIRNLGAEHRGRYRRILRRLAARISSGTTVVDALEQTPDALSDSMVLALRFASQSGTLTQAYDELLHPAAHDAQYLQASVRSFVAYWSIPALALCVFLTYAYTKYVPMLNRFNQDFGTDETYYFPPFRSAVNFFGSLGPALLIAVVILGWLLTAGQTRRFLRRSSIGRLFPNVARVRSVEFLRLLASAIDAGRPLPGALSTLARYHFDRGLREKLLYARNEVEQGQDVWVSLADAKLLTKKESAALSSAPTSEVRSWTLRQLATWKMATLQRQVLWALEILHPAIVLAYAAIVLWSCLAIFGFLTHLINGNV